MELKEGDFVELVVVPSRIDRAGASEQQVHRACLGSKLGVMRVDEDGICVFQLHQEWSHFPGITPFELRFDAACLQRSSPSQTPNGQPYQTGQNATRRAPAR